MISKHICDLSKSIKGHKRSDLHMYEGPSWSWSYGSWIINYLCNQCLSPLMLWVRISIMSDVQHYVIKFVSDLRLLVVLCNQCLSSLMLWVRISIRARCTTCKFVSDLRQVSSFLRVLRFTVTCDRSVVFSESSGFLHQ